MSLEVGQKLGAHEIVALIGKGGMGEGLSRPGRKARPRSRHQGTPPRARRSPERVARFERETKVLASLNYPNIASIHGFGEYDGVNALVLELAEGPTLAERIEQGPIPGSRS